MPNGSGHGLAAARINIVAEMIESTGPFSGRTAWARNLEAPLRDFLRTETGSAAILLAATLAALISLQRKAA